MTKQARIPLSTLEGLILTYQSQSVAADTLGAAAVAYLLAYGWTKSLQDSVAGLAKKLDGEGKTKEEVDAAVAAKMAERADAICAGTVSHGSRGPARKGLDKHIFEVTVEKLRVIAKTKGQSWPNGKGSAEKVAGLVEKYLDVPHLKTTVLEEARRRVMADAEAESLDFDFTA